ncbi:histidine kinase [Thermopolyspora sp. NPDC052614]|uniref:sensor histidine kinase n=1 Tax=Thermopolyspora sp. NPDC052614 TaxID=3155682 RepID=UPI003445EBB4
MRLLRRLKELALIGAFAPALLFDMLLVASREAVEIDGLCLAAGMVGFTAVILRHRKLIGMLIASLTMSAAVTAFDLAVLGTGEGHPGLTEMGALLFLTISVVRRVQPFSAAAALAIATMVVLEAQALRFLIWGTFDGVVLVFFLFILWVVAASIGGYFRFQQVRREEALESVRRAERLDIARELHDLVAHHITGIVVQAQAARAVGEQRPEAVLPALDAIATAGGDALTAMRRLVTVLRSDEEAARTPGTSLSDLRVLVDGFAAGDGPQVAFDVGQGVSSADLPPEVLTTLHRVLQESLTNIRKHAPGTTWVEVDLSLVPEGVRLRVRNYGSGGGMGDPRLSRLGGGFGLVGMAERVEALGGTLTAGFTPQGAWEVCAVLKCDPEAARRPVA